MNIFQLSIVDAVAHCRNLLEAADKVHITQPSLTYQINRIEDELGFKLFDRTRQGTTPTEAGIVFCEGAAQIVSEYEQLVRHARRMAEDEAGTTLRLAITLDYTSAISSLVREAASHAPEVRFTMVSYPNSVAAAAAVETGRADLVYRNAPTSMPEGLEFMPVALTPEVCLMAAGHPLANEDSVSLEDMRGFKLWLVPQGTVSHTADDLRRAIKRGRIRDINVCEYHDEEVVTMSLLAENALAVSHKGTSAFMAGSIVERALDWPNAEEVEGALYRVQDAPWIRPILESIGWGQLLSPAENSGG